MTEESKYLLALARRVAEPFLVLPETRAMMVTGSVAEGLSDQYSDLDIMAYYETLPSEDDIEECRLQNGGAERVWVMGDRAEGAFAEAYDVHGVQCQIGHHTIEAWQGHMAQVLEKHDVESPLQKAMTGLLICKPLYGADLIAQWQRKIADYPPALSRAMVEHYLKFFPVWGLRNWMQPRDATVWHYQIMVESAQHLLGVLAGLNRIYYTTFQFKRMHRFAAELDIVPENLSERLEKLFEPDRSVAAETLEGLVADIVALVEKHVPEVDTKAASSRLGWRHEPWTPVKL